MAGKFCFPGYLLAIFLSSLSWTSSMKTVTYKTVNDQLLQLDVYLPGTVEVPTVSDSCLAKLVEYCGHSYDSDHGTKCIDCIADHHKHLVLAGCSSNLTVVDSYYCGIDGVRRVGGGEVAVDPRPTIVYIHGGGWEFGSKNIVPDYIRSVAEQQRYALVSVQYRLTSEAEKWGGVEAVTWPAQREDCLDALRFLHKYAQDFGIDTDRMACWGGSAGGHLCSFTAVYGATNSSETTLKVAIPFYGPTDILDMTLDIDPKVGCHIDHDAVGSFESKLLGSERTNISIGELRRNENQTSPPWPQLVALAHSVNPVNFVSAKTPQMFVAHGTDDHTVPFKQSVRLVDALEKAEIPHQFFPAVGCDHATEPRDCWQKAVAAAQQWLISHL